MDEVDIHGRVYELEDIIGEAVKKTLINFGIDTSDPIEMQKDFAYLRAWRLGADEVKTKGVLAILGMMLVGMVGALWVGFKSNLH